MKTPKQVRRIAISADARGIDMVVSVDKFHRFDVYVVRRDCLIWFTTFDSFDDYLEFARRHPSKHFEFIPYIS